jgi:hypothetical protein
MFFKAPFVVARWNMAVLITDPVSRKESRGFFITVQFGETALLDSIPFSLDFATLFYEGG